MNLSQTIAEIQTVSESIDGGQAMAILADALARMRLVERLEKLEAPRVVTMGMDAVDPLLTSQEAMKRLGVGHTKFDAMKKTGWLPSSRHGKSDMFRLSTINGFIHRMESTPERHRFNLLVAKLKEQKEKKKAPALRAVR